MRIKPTHVYQAAELMNITICYALRQNKLLVKLAKRFNSLWTGGNLEYQLFFSEVDIHNKQETAINDQVKFIYFDKWLLNMEKEMKHANNPLVDEISKPITVITNELAGLALLTTALSFEDALEMFYRVREICHLQLQRYKYAMATDVKKSF